MSGEIRVVQNDAIARVTLCNPGKRNAIDAAMWRELKRTMEALSADLTIRVVIIGGEGEHFAAGGDIEEFCTLRRTLEQAQRYHGDWVAGALHSIATCPHPTIASIRGACVGGGLEIAAQCDLRIAATSARLGAPIMKLGFAMAAAELAGLLALAGPATTLEILLEGRLLDAAEAVQKGLLTRITSEAELEAETLASARRIAAGAPLVARIHKPLVRRLMAAAAALSEAEIRASFAWLDSADYAEGIDAFLAKRTPEFLGK